jgi:hypothetical protein
MSIAIAFPCETCDDTGDDVWKFKPAWASIAGYGTRCVHWSKEGSESLDRRWPMADPPEIGGTYALRVGHLFKGAQAEPFWVLFQPAHSAVHGWEEYPEELGASSMVKCHLLNVRANEGEQSAWLRIHVVDMMRLHELSRRVEVQEADSLPPYPTQRTVRADWGDLTYFNGNMEGDVGVWFVCQRLEERPTLLLYGEWAWHADFVYAGNRRLTHTEFRLLEKDFREGPTCESPTLPRMPHVLGAYPCMHPTAAKREKRWGQVLHDARHGLTTQWN